VNQCRPLEEGEAPSIARAQKRREEREESNAERLHEAGPTWVHGSQLLSNISHRDCHNFHSKVELIVYLGTARWPWHEERQQLRVARVAGAYTRPLFSST